MRWPAILRELRRLRPPGPARVYGVTELLYDVAHYRAHGRPYFSPEQRAAMVTDPAVAAALERLKTYRWGDNVISLPGEEHASVRLQHLRPNSCPGRPSPVPPLPDK